MSEIQFFTEVNASSFWKSLRKTLRSNIFLLNYITLEHDITFTFNLNYPFTVLNSLAEDIIPR